MARDTMRAKPTVRDLDQAARHTVETLLVSSPARGTPGGRAADHFRDWTIRALRGYLSGRRDQEYLARLVPTLAEVMDRMVLAELSVDVETGEAARRRLEGGGLTRVQAEDARGQAEDGESAARVLAWAYPEEANTEA